MPAPRQRAGAPIERLRRRADFLAVAAGRSRHSTPGLVLQAKARRQHSRATDQLPTATVHGEATANATADPTAAVVRLGFTASRKVGGAVARNRARRRLRAAAQAVLPAHAARGHDYVIIARAQTLDRPFPLLLADLEQAMRRLGLWQEERP
jgi:ribonuclease P protein component